MKVVVLIVLSLIVVGVDIVCEVKSFLASTLIFNIPLLLDGVMVFIL